MGRHFVIPCVPIPLLRKVVQLSSHQGLSPRELGIGALQLILDLEEAVTALLVAGKSIPPCAWRQAFPERDQDDLDGHAQYCPLCAAANRQSSTPD